MNSFTHNSILNSSLVKTTFVLFFTCILTQALAQNASSPDWLIKKTEWSDTDEKAYSEFIAALGAAVEKKECSSLNSCLRHKNNPYRGSDIQNLNVFADCAKLSYILRGYFAWKNALPFSIANGMKLRDVPENSGDKRYSKFGNQVSSRLDFVPRLKNGSWIIPKAVQSLQQTIPDSVNSANFRFSYEVSDIPKFFTDYYPISINRLSIRPGTIIYDPNGHVAIVYKVTDDGRIYFIDAHPDNSLTSGLYGTKFVRSNPGQGAGFKNFRPIRYVGGQYDSNLGSYVGGSIEPALNKNLKDFDLVQFFGTNRQPRPDWSKGPFILNQTALDYYDYVRTQLSKGSLKLNPANEVTALSQDLCQTIQDRAEAVQAAIKAGLQNKTHPDRLPENIYGTSGEWEEFSTPSRDARLKTTFVELRKLVETLNKKFEQHDPQVVYTGTDIKKDMLSAYLETSNQCLVQYKKSNSTEQVTLNLEQVRSRLFQLSFDPYHCIERRWGASDPAELNSCNDDTNDSQKTAWYQAEQRLRNQIERRYDAKMDFNLNDLISGLKPGSGIDSAPDTDIIRYLTTAP